MAGAAIATGLGEIIGGIVPVIYFARKNSSLLRLKKARFNARNDNCKPNSVNTKNNRQE